MRSPQVQGGKTDGNDEGIGINKNQYWGQLGVRTIRRLPIGILNRIRLSL
jgi:hypothetical protein